jgi:hypothetical protein
VPRTEPRTAPTTTPELEDPDDVSRGRVTCAVCVGGVVMATVANVVAAALQMIQVSKC